MNKQELEEKIKEKFESVYEKLFRLEVKYSNNMEIQDSLSVIAFTVGAVLAEARIQLTGNDKKYSSLFSTLSSPRNYTQPMIPALPPMSLQECADFMERADKTLDMEEKILEFAKQIKKEGKV